MVGLLRSEQMDVPIYPVQDGLASRQTPVKWRGRLNLQDREPTPSVPPDNIVQSRLTVGISRTGYHGHQPCAARQEKR